MQVCFTVSADMYDGKGLEDRQWAVKLANYLNEKFPDTTVEVCQQIGGPSNRLIWVGKHASLGTCEAFREKYEADEGFQQLMVEGVGLLRGMSTTKDFTELYHRCGSESSQAVLRGPGPAMASGYPANIHSTLTSVLAQ